MKLLTRQFRGNTSLVIGEIIVGIVLLFAAIFMLASIEPLYGTLTDCSYSSYAGTPQFTLNATSDSGSTSANMTFTITTASQRGYCRLLLVVTNASAAAGSYVEVSNAASPGTVIGNVTVPATNTELNVSSGVTSGTFIANVTAFGDDNVTINSTSRLSCCSTLVAKRTPAGQHYNAMVTMIATIFAVFGLLLIVIGLSVAVRTLKEMF